MTESWSIWLFLYRYLDQRREVERLRYELSDDQSKLCVQQEVLKQIRQSLDKAGDNIPDVLDFSMESDKQDDSSTVSLTNRICYLCLTEIDLSQSRVVCCNKSQSRL